MRKNPDEKFSFHLGLTNKDTCNCDKITITNLEKGGEKRENA